MLEGGVLKKWAVEVRVGKANLEVRPTFGNNGYSATRRIREFGTQRGEAPDFVLCLGDDQTDEGEFLSPHTSLLCSPKVPPFLPPFLETTGARADP